MRNDSVFQLLHWRYLTSTASCGSSKDKMPCSSISTSPCKSLFLLNTLHNQPISTINRKNPSSKHRALISKKPNFPISLNSTPLPEKNPNVKNPVFSFLKRTHVVFSSTRTGSALESTTDEENSNLDIGSSNSNSRNEGIEETEVELLGKPILVLPPSTNSDSEEEVSDGRKPEKDEVLAPFLKFFKPRDALHENKGMGDSELVNQVKKEVNVEYYDPKSGDLVLGIVVSGNENKLDVNIGADLLGTMLTKEVLPLYEEELPHLLCDLNKDGDEFMVPGKIGVVKDEEALNGDSIPGRPVVETGTILFAEVLGRTLSGRPLLSTRRLIRRVAWHRVRQIKQLGEPIEVRITEWNTGGLLSRIEGLRAFLPKAELVNRVNSFTALKQNIGRRILVKIIRIDEANNDLIISEREAWDMLHLQEGTLLDGTVRKIFPYGAQVRIGDSNRSGLLHISNITGAQITSVNDLLEVDEKVKVLVVKSTFPGKISLSIADLESEPGLFLRNKEKVYAEAKEMAKKYRKKIPVIFVNRRSDQNQSENLPFDDEAGSYSNWDWFKFEPDSEQ